MAVLDVSLRHDSNGPVPDRDRSFDIHDCGFSIPSLVVHPLDDFDVSNNALWLCRLLPDGLTHLYANGNPLHTNTSTLIDVLEHHDALAALDIQFLNGPLVFNRRNDPAVSVVQAIATALVFPRRPSHPGNASACSGSCVSMMGSAMPRWRRR